MSFFSKVLCWPFILALMIGCTPAYDETVFDRREYFYNSNEQMDLFLENEALFLDLKTVLEESEYSYLIVDQETTGEIVWMLSKMVVEEEGEILKIIAVSEEELDPLVVSTINNFFDTLHCRDVHWFGNELTISFWNEWGNDGIIYCPARPLTAGNKYHTLLSDDWYYYAYPIT